MSCFIQSAARQPSSNLHVARARNFAEGGKRSPALALLTRQFIRNFAVSEVEGRRKTLLRAREFIRSGAEQRERGERMMKDTGVRRGPRVLRRSFADVSFDRVIRKGTGSSDEATELFSRRGVYFYGSASTTVHHLPRVKKSPRTNDQLYLFDRGTCDHGQIVETLLFPAEFIARARPRASRDGRKVSG